MGVYHPLLLGKAHGYIIAWMEGDKVQLLTKFSEFGEGEGSRTDSPTMSLNQCHAMASDCIYYEDAQV